MRNRWTRARIDYHPCITSERLTKCASGTTFIPLYHFHTLTNVRWLSHIFNHAACIYQIATRWYLPPYRITIWLIDDVMLIFVCLIDDLALGFCFSQFDTGNRWTRTHIDYHSCITSKPTNSFLIFPNILRSYVLCCSATRETTRMYQVCK